MNALIVKAFFNKPLKFRVFRGLLLALFLAFVLVVTPTPYRLQAPGVAEAVAPMINIESQTYPVGGTFLLPTVVSEPATLLYCLYSLIERDATLTTDSENEPLAQSPGGGDDQMGLSQYLSTIVALEALGHDLKGKFSGLRVLSVDEESPNQNVLKRGDLLVALGGERLSSFQDFKKQIEALPPGDKLEATVERKGKPSKLKVTSFRPEGRSILGIMIRPELKDATLPFPITFKDSSTSGASGGLVFALEIYNRLTPDDITRGRRIAVTGTLDPAGNVGAVEGIHFKLIGAKRAQSTLVLIPKDNRDDLRGEIEGLEVIPVDSFNEALDALKN